MRALGPGSVSSFLKVILDVFFYIVWAAAIAVAVGVIVALVVLTLKPELLGGRMIVDQWRLSGPTAAPVVAAILTAVELNLVGVIVIVGRLRRIFQTMIVGDPFHPDNVRRLRVIALALAALEVGRYVFAALAHLIPLTRKFEGGVNLTTWFAILVILVLAEVFREGARLRREAELTI